MPPFQLAAISFLRLSCVYRHSFIFSSLARKLVFYNEDGETLEQVAQRGSRCPIPGNIQGQVGWGSEKPDLVEDVPAYCRGIGLDNL